MPMSPTPQSPGDVASRSVPQSDGENQSRKRERPLTISAIDAQLFHESSVLDRDGVGRLDVQLLGEVQGQLLRLLPLDDDPVLFHNQIGEFFNPRRFTRFGLIIPEDF